MLTPQIEEKGLYDWIVQGCLVSAYMDVDEIDRPQLEAEVTWSRSWWRLCYYWGSECWTIYHTLGKVGLECGQVGGRYDRSVGQPKIYYTPFNSS